MKKPDPSFNLPAHDGIVFIDVFNPNQRPHGNPLNYGMIYVVPPNNSGSNYPNDSAFLEAIKATCITIVEALNDFNNLHAAPGNPAGLQPMNNVRMCLFSGGVYAGGTPPSDVARYNLEGLESGIAAGSGNTIALIEFEYDMVHGWLTDV